MREAPSISIISALQKAGARVQVYDPEGMEQARHFLRDVKYTDSAYDCATDCDCLVLATEWREFQSLDFNVLGSVMRQLTIVDLRNALDRSKAEAEGFAVHGIGVKAPPRQANTIRQLKTESQVDTAAPPVRGVVHSRGIAVDLVTATSS
jgi:UDPglucose 6-dehydrogenase